MIQKSSDTIKGTWSPLITYKFIKNPYTFSKYMEHRYGSPYWFYLNGKQIYGISDDDIISNLQHIRSSFFEPEEIFKSLGRNSLLLLNEDHMLLKYKIIEALSKINLDIIDLALKVFTDKYLSFDVKNGKDLIDKILLDVIVALVAGRIDNLLAYEFGKCIKNLTAAVMFIPFIKLNIPFTKWKKFLIAKTNLVNQIKVLRNVENSLPYNLRMAGCSEEELIDNTFLFLFASFDNPALTIANLFISKSSHIKHSLDIYPTIPFIVKTIHEPLYTKEYVFKSGSHFAIDLIHWEKTDKTFGFGKTKCPGKQLTFVLVEKILNFLNQYFIILNYDNIKYNRHRFSYGVSYFEIGRKR